MNVYYDEDEKKDKNNDKSLNLGKKGRLIVAIEASLSITLILTLYWLFLPNEMIDGFIFSILFVLITLYIFMKDMGTPSVKTLLETTEKTEKEKAEESENKKEKPQKVIINADTIKEIEDNKANINLNKKENKIGKFGVKKTINNDIKTTSNKKNNNKDIKKNK